MNRPNHSWILVERPRRYLDVIGAHLPLALVCGLLLGAAAFVPLHWMTLRQCTFLGITGIPCLFCGGSRAFQLMAHGAWGEAFVISPMAALLFLLTAFVLLWNLCGLLTGCCLRPGPQLRIWEGRKKRIGLAVVGLVLLNWIYRIATGQDANL